MLTLTVSHTDTLKTTLAVRTSALGCPTHLGAAVLLPVDHAAHTARRPSISSSMWSQAKVLTSCRRYRSRAAVRLPPSLRVLRLEGDYIDAADTSIHSYGA